MSVRPERVGNNPTRERDSTHVPFRMSIPLPGPFSYSRRIGGGKRRSSGQHGALFWIAVGWWLYPLVWMVLGTWWLLKMAAVALVALARLVQQR